MIYRDFKNLRLSALGFGAMRLPLIGGNDATIDEALTMNMVANAMEHGINYYDTAWGYHGEKSEIVLGKALKPFDRDSFYLATKFPGYDLSNMNKVESIFECQLEKCSVDYFDFYLFHNVCEMNIDGYLDKNNGIIDYLLKQKENGRIRHLGFSAHGSTEIIKRFLEAYGKHMEFGQLQLNYVDWSFQDAKSKMELLKEYQLPVWVMEPLRGGKLTVLPDEDTTKLKALRPDENVTAWAFRFLQTLPDVVVTLSGMSNMEQLRANAQTYETDKPLSEQELNTLLGIAGDIVRKIALPCTACNYCASHCPQELDIPMLLELYNEHYFTGGGFIAPMAMMAVPADKQPSACIGCGGCEAVCPQQIKIAAAMTDFSHKLNA